MRTRLQTELYDGIAAASGKAKQEAQQQVPSVAVLGELFEQIRTASSRAETLLEKPADNEPARQRLVTGLAAIKAAAESAQDEISSGSPAVEDMLAMIGEQFGAIDAALADALEAYTLLKDR